MIFEIIVSQTSTMTTDEVWPNGDAPDNPTAADVVEAMQAEHSHPWGVAQDWNLIDSPEIAVSDDTQTEFY